MGEALAIEDPTIQDPIPDRSPLAVRRAAGVSRTLLARLAGVTEGTIERYEDESRRDRVSEGTRARLERVYLAMVALCEACDRGDLRPLLR